jgi:hypothetical protein
MLKVTIRKNGVVVPSVTTTSQRVIYTKFEEVVTFTSNDRMTMEHVWEESDETT